MPHGPSTRSPTAPCLSPSITAPGSMSGSNPPSRAWRGAHDRPTPSKVQRYPAATPAPHWGSSASINFQGTTASTPDGTCHRHHPNLPPWQARSGLASVSRSRSPLAGRFASSASAQYLSSTTTACRLAECWPRCATRAYARGRSSSSRSARCKSQCPFCRSSRPATAR